MIRIGLKLGQLCSMKGKNCCGLSRTTDLIRIRYSSARLDRVHELMPLASLPADPFLNGWTERQISTGSIYLTITASRRLSDCDAVLNRRP